MDIIFLTPDGRQSFQLAAGGFRLAVIAAVLLVMGALYGGMKLGIDSVRVPPTGAVSVWHEDLALQEMTVNEALRRGEESLDALAVRLGQLQAQSMRMEALGERLVRTAKLDPDEFGFDRPPPIGGPRPAAAAASTVPDFLADLRELEARLSDRRPKLEVLESVLLNRELHLRTRPSRRPVKSGWRSSGYGYRRDPVTGQRVFHHGVDYAGRRASEVVAVAAGVVAEAGSRAGYGRTLRINHGDGYETRYAHNLKNLVSAGQIVERGQPIALMGSSGRTTGTHVHFEVLRYGKTVNPEQLIGTEH